MSLIARLWPLTVIAVLGACVRPSRGRDATSAPDVTEPLSALAASAGPGELVVALRYQPKKGFRFTQARFQVDGQTTRVVSQGGKSQDLEVYRNRVAPGVHTVSVVVNVASPGRGGLMVRAGRSTAVDVPAGAGACIVAEIFHSERELRAGSGQSTFIVWRTDCKPASI
jgi:hypothetical protein